MDDGGDGVVIEVKLSINQPTMENQKSSKCVICGKLFRTMKALYGHMRSHPDRTWRGMHPSTSTSARSSSSSSASSAPASPPLPTWLVTGRRGRKRTASASASTTADDSVSYSNDLKETRTDELCSGSSSIRKVHQYKCNVCGKKFWSPQALGGHKSSHYKPEKTNLVVLPPSSTNQSGRRMLDFDLNELPPMDDGEGI